MVWTTNQTYFYEVYPKWAAPSPTQEVSWRFINLGWHFIVLWDCPRMGDTTEPHKNIPLLGNFRIWKSHTGRFIHNCPQRQVLSLTMNSVWHGWRYCHQHWHSWVPGRSPLTTYETYSFWAGQLPRNLNSGCFWMVSTWIVMPNWRA